MTHLHSINSETDEKTIIKDFAIDLRRIVGKKGLSGPENSNYSRMKTVF